MKLEMAYIVSERQIFSQRIFTLSESLHPDNPTGLC